MKKVLFTAVFLFIASIGFSQSVKWLNSSGGSGSPQIRDLAVDQAGFIYAVGSFNANMSVHGNAVNTQGGFDVFITKFDPNGNFIWIKTISRAGLLTPELRINEIGAGGLSGLPVKQRSTDIIKYITDKTNGAIPIIASGGVFTGIDAKEKLDAGASLVQVWTGFIYEGPAIVKQICKSL